MCSLPEQANAVSLRGKAEAVTSTPKIACGWSQNPVALMKVMQCQHPKHCPSCSIGIVTVKAWGYITRHSFFKKILPLPPSVHPSFPPLPPPLPLSFLPSFIHSSPSFSRKNWKLRDIQMYLDLKRFARKTLANDRGNFELFVINLRHFFLGCVVFYSNWFLQCRKTICQ